MKILQPAQVRHRQYRQYSESTVEELRMLKYARDLGLPLSEIKKLIIGCDNGDCSHSKEYVITSIENYLHHLNLKISEMQTLQLKLIELRKTLASTTAQCEEGPFCCNILHQIVMSEIKKEGDIHGR